MLILDRQLVFLVARGLAANKACLQLRPTPVGQELSAANVSEYLLQLRLTISTVFVQFVGRQTCTWADSDSLTFTLSEDLSSFSKLTPLCVSPSKLKHHIRDQHLDQGKKAENALWIMHRVLEQKCFFNLDGSCSLHFRRQWASCKNVFVLLS